MISSMQRFGSALMVACFALAGCIGEPQDVDVTPASSTGAFVRKIQPLPPPRFEGQPTRIGFEPVRLEGIEFPEISGFAFLPDSNNFLLVNRSGMVGWFRMEGDHARAVGTFQIPAVFTEGDCGVTSIVVDPDFVNNGNFYVIYCLDVRFSVVKRYQMDYDNFPDTLYSSSNIIAIGDSDARVASNSAGSMSFSPDGVLWIALGDKANKDNAQNLSNELGKVIRIIPRTLANSNGYVVPKNNPFSNDNTKSRTMYASGLHNPRSAAMDARGRFWFADAGVDSVQEINVVAVPAENFGWPDADGRTCLTDDCSKTSPPVRHWDDDSQHAFVLADTLIKRDPLSRAAWVGIEYNAQKKDRYAGLLTGKMLYGDGSLGFVRGVTIGMDGAVVGDVHLGHVEMPVAWQQGADGYLYVATLAVGPSPSAQSGTGASMAAKERFWRVVPLP